MFKFRLQTVLEYRIVIEERMLQRFTEAARHMNEGRMQLELLEQERFTLIDMLKNPRKKSTTVEDISLLVRYISDLQSRENRQREIVLELEKELNARRKELVESVQKRKMLEKLKEKNLEDYQADLADYDRKFMDEVAVTRFVREKS